jgi:23S rRNA pseudouridine2604 synthase
MLIRIEKYLSEQGIMSRREAKKYLLEKLISVNGKIASPGDKIDPKKDKLSYKKEIQKNIEEKITIAVYKPRGVISSKDKDRGKNIFDVFPQFKKLNTVGRLDKESEGLILLSNDGMITKAITGKEHKIEKEYVVEVREKILPWMMKKMSDGMQLQDGWTLPAKAKKINTHTFKIILKEGRKHQIRRMSNECKLTINSLKRIRIHNIKIGRMLPGNFKKLTKQEIEDLKKYAKKTTK